MRFAFSSSINSYTITAHILIFFIFFLIKRYLGKDTEEDHLPGLHDILFFISKLR